MSCNLLTHRVWIMNTLFHPSCPPRTQTPLHGVSMAKVIIQLNPFTVFIHVHFQTLFQTARSALVSVSFVDGTSALYRERDGERKRVTACGWISLSFHDRRLLAIIFLGGQSPGERSRYYLAVIDLLPCGSSASSSRRISTPSRPLLPKSSPSSHHIRLDYTWYIIAARCLAQYLMVEAWHN